MEDTKVRSSVFQEVFGRLASLARLGFVSLQKFPPIPAYVALRLNHMIQNWAVPKDMDHKDPIYI